MTVTAKAEVAARYKSHFNKALSGHPGCLAELGLPKMTVFELPVAFVEDIVGLKMQALANDPSRALADWNDICLLLAAAREQQLKRN